MVKRRVKHLFRILQVLNFALKDTLPYNSIITYFFIPLIHLIVANILIGDEDADERYVLDPVGSEKGKPIIKGGVLGDTKDRTEVKFDPTGWVREY